MNKEDLLQILNEQPKWRRKMILPFGIETPGRDRAQIVNRIFPPDSEGRSVLDVGCREGFFCFEAKIRNAGRVAGVELNKSSLSTAVKINNVLGTDVEFLAHDVNRIEELGTFDYVLCLNIPHHLKDPVYLIHKLAHITRTKLVLEVEDLHVKKPDIGRSWWRLLFNLLPSGLQPAVLMIDPRGRFLMSRRWIKELFQNQYSSIEGIEFLDSDRPNRYIALVSMRRVKNLRVISGASGVGKTVFIDKLMASQEGAAEILDFSLEDGWQVVTGKHMKTSTGGRTDKLLLHYNITKPVKKSFVYYEDDPALIIKRAASKMVYVLVCQPDILIERIRKRGSDRRSSKQIKRAKWLLEEYSRPGRLRSLYEDWISFCKENGCDIKYIDVGSDRIRVITEEEALRFVSL